MLRLVGIFVLLGGALVPSQLNAQITVGIAPWDLEVAVGSTFEMEYWIGGLGEFEAPALASFDLTMDYDEALVSFDSATVGTMLGDVGAGEATAIITLVPGGVHVTETSLLTPAQLIAMQPRSFIVFKARFVAQALGDASFEPSVASILDENGQPLNLELGALANVHIVEPRAIPTLTGWSMGGLIGVLLLAGVLMLRRTGLG